MSKKRGNGNGGIIDRGKGRYLRWSIRITVGYDAEKGRQLYKYLSSHHTKKEAELALAEYLTNPNRQSILHKLTFAQIFEKAFEDYKLSPHSKSAIYGYQTAFKNCTTLHDLPITEVRTAQLQEVIDNSTARSTSSLGNLIKLYNMVFRYAIQNDYVQKNYASFVKIRNTVPTKKRTLFTEDDILQMWDNCESDNTKITLILLYTGLRVNELLTLKKSDIFLSDDYFVGGSKTAAGKNRTVPIHKRIKPFFEYFLKNSKNTDTMLNVLYKHYASWLKSEWNHTPHDTRHTFTTLMQKYGANQIWLDKIIGHSSGNLTNDLYTHTDLDALKETINLLP